MKTADKKVKIETRKRVNYDPVDMFYQSLLNDKAVDPRFRKDVRVIRGR